MADNGFAGADDISCAMSLPAAELGDGTVAVRGVCLDGVAVGALLVETVVNNTV